ncbi:MAG: hypothetical protein JWO40_864 [Candidatus Doudnabacteria bacterium]|nr:hypothetical protein [Candidatus Doudnabacteria bacterium]
MEIYHNDTYQEPLQDETSLIIVSGEHIAKMYKFEDGRLTPEPVVHVEHTVYTDAEGYRGRDNSISALGTSSDNEKKDTGERHDFSVQFKTKVEELSRDNKFDWFYLFAPQEVMPQIRGLLPADWQKKLRFTYSGNFTKAMPAELQEIIKTNFAALKPESWTAREEEAKSILNNTNSLQGSA